MFDHTSRYADVPTETLTTVDGREIRYVRRRFLPPASSLPTLVDLVVTAGDRLDNLTARSLGDPTLFWRICDANNAMRPDELLEDPGSSLRVPIPQP